MVRRIFELRADGIAFNAIARQLNLEGVPSPGKLRYDRGMTKAAKYRDALWIRGTIRKITGDVVYVGSRVHGKVGRDRLGAEKKKRPQEEWKIIPNAHPSIIPQNLFDQVQLVNRAELERRAKFDTQAGPEDDYRVVLRGKIFCGDCGARMTAGKYVSRKSSSCPNAVYFNCNEYRDSNHQRCSNHYIRQEVIIDALKHFLDEQVKLFVDVEELAAKARREDGMTGALRGRQLALRNRREELASEQLRYLEDLTDGILDRETFLRLKENCQRELAALADQEAAVKSEHERQKAALSAVEMWLAAIRRYRQLPRLDRGLIDALVEKILVFEDRSIHICLTYRDPIALFTEGPAQSREVTSVRDRKRKIQYLRVSMEDAAVAAGAELESLSISGQRLCIKEYIASHPDLGCVDEFEELVDDGQSGTNFDRPAVAKLLEWVEAEQVETIIVRDMSRFGRNYLEVGHFLEYVFPLFDVHFISINDHFDSADLDGSTAGFQMAIRNLINQMYSRDIFQKIKSSVDMKKLSGEFIYGTAPYGYKKGTQKNTIVVDPQAAEVVRNIFQWAADRITVTKIAKRLNDAGVMSPSEYLKDIRGKYKTRPYWSYESVRNILLNRIYTGDTVPFKSHVVAVGSKRTKAITEEEQLVLPDTHEAIVSRELYYQARAVVKSHVKSKSQGGSLLSTYLVCGCCGNKLQKGRKTNRAFRYATSHYAPDAPCKEVHIVEEYLAALIAEKNSRETMIQGAGSIRRFASITALTPALLHALVQRIIVYPDGAVHIDWKFRDEMAAGAGEEYLGAG